MSKPLSERGKLVEKVVEGSMPPTTPGVPLDKSKGIDDLLLEGLYQIQRLLWCVKKDIDTGSPERDTVQNLKDVMGMLHELKKKEAELIEDLTDEELERLANK